MPRVLLFLVSLLATTLFAADTPDRAVRERVVVKAPVAEVWKAWTTNDGVTSFFAPGANIDLKVDGPYEIYMNPYAEPGMKGADNMRVIGYQENQMLSFTWNAPPSLPEARKQRTHVTVRFAPAGEGETLVTLSHAGWGTGGEWDKAFDYFTRVWPGVLAQLKLRFEKGPRDWSQWLEQMKKATDGAKK